MTESNTGLTIWEQKFNWFQSMHLGPTATTTVSCPAAQLGYRRFTHDASIKRILISIINNSNPFFYNSLLLVMQMERRKQAGHLAASSCESPGLLSEIGKKWFSALSFN